MEEGFVKRLISNMKCAVCGQRYAQDNIKVLGRREDLWFLGVFCPICGSQALIAALVKEHQAPEIVVSDLSRSEFCKFAASEPISADDVLDMHEFLKNFEGDFLTLLSS
jgi:uncharacterized Zn finger protein